MEPLAKKKLRFRRREALLLWIREKGELLLAGPVPKYYPGGAAWHALIKAVLPNPLKPASLRTALWRLEQEGFVQKTGGRGDPSYRLTEQGENYSAWVVEYLNQPSPLLPQRWDGKWRVVIFDVPERFKKDRERIRRTLAYYGFQQLQKSVWISPFPLPDVAHTFFAEWHLKEHAYYLLVESIDEEKAVIKRWGGVWGI